ncbi:MAG: DedA family protein [Candidatus Helarchaeota archaeon]|nr:DedA family protein [Candidatus Helarchaeota archaeon]
MKFLKFLYEWVLSWANSRYGTLALFLVAFSESSVFIVPPDVLLIALSVSRPKRAFFYAVVSTVGSVLGGVFGYIIGFKVMESIGIPILDFYGVMDKFEYVAILYNKYNAWAVSIAGFTPIPYKLFTIAAGAAKINFPIFFFASLCSRGARFFIVGGLIFFFGAKIKYFIEKYFNLLSVIFIILLVGGFIVIKLILGD